ncbi:hypothetical protein AGMMS49574_15890 [Bacteroidia bacterium]|nr:hypothetical protein AGMMS49574_15890 [Bacteroidia bacterium]
MKHENFISKDELDIFKEKNRYFNRHGLKINSNGTTEKLTQRTIDGNSKNSSVEDVISKLVSDHIKSTRQSKLITVEMFEEDGMSWFSQKLYESKKALYSHFHFFNINNYSKDTYNLPSIAYEIGVKDFVRSAIKNKICSGEGFKYMLFSSWLQLLLSTALTFIIQFIIAVFQSISLSSFFNLTFIALFVALTTISVLSKYLNEKSVLQSDADAMRKFIQQLNEVCKDVQAKENKSTHKNKFDNFISDIVENLISKEFPRFFIIDNFNRLDYVTRSVIKQYWKNNISEDKIRGKEIWIIIESQNNNEKLSTFLIQDKSNSKFIDNFIQLRVLPFSEEEKEKLVACCEVDKSCAEFAYARYVCNGYAKNQTWILEELKGKNKYLLNFLYLVSITQVTVDIERADNILQNDNCCKNILKQFLGEEYNNFRLKNHIKDITETFKNLLVENTNRPLRDTFFTMQQNESELQISNHKLGHIFWALYWGYILKKNPYDIFWVEKLSYHLVNSDFSTLPQENNETYIKQLLDYCIYAIEGNINFGTINDIYSLLNVAKDLLLNSKIEKKTIYNKFVFLCWQSYILCKDERIINLFVLLANKDIANSDKEIDVALQLYLELLPIAVLGNEQTVKDFANWLSNYSDADILIRYMKIQSIWLSLSIAPMNRDFHTMLVANVANQSSSDIETILNAIIENDNTDKTAILFDLISISVLLWVNCLKIYNDIHLFLDSTAHRININYLKTAFANMVDYFAKAVAYLKSKGFIEQSENLNHFEKAIIGEITLTMLSALTASYKCIKDSPFANKISERELSAKINLQIDDTNKIIHFDLPQINDLDDLCCPYFSDTIENNFNFQSLIWQKLNLSELGNNLIIKRIQYNVLTKERDVESVDYNIINAIHEAANKQTQIGVLANIVIANYLEKIAQLSSYYFVQAGDIMIKEQFGNKMVRDISLLTIVYFNSFNTDLSRFAANITDDSDIAQNDNYLLTTLATIPEEQFFNVLLQLSNSSRNIQDKSVSNKFNKLIRSYPDNIKSERLKKRSKALFEFVEVSEQINKNSSTNATEVLKNWADKRDYFMYAALLTQLINNGCSDEIVKREIITTMKRPQDPNGNYNSYLHLAIAYARKFLLNNEHITNDEWDYILDYIYNPKIKMEENNCVEWEARETVHTNKEMYELLTYFYPNEQFFATKLFYWGLKVSEIEHKQLIPNLLQQGHFFLLFKKYTEDALQYGLSLNQELYQYGQELGIEEIDKQKKIQEWLQQNNGIPTPIINGNCVCAEFLIIGSCFFSRFLINAEEYKEHRRKFNEMSNTYIMQLVDLILNTTKVPEYYKHIITDFYSGLQNQKRLKE